MPQLKTVGLGILMFFKNVSRQHNICFKIKIAIFTERYPLFYWHRATNVKINNSVSGWFWKL